MQGERTRFFLAALMLCCAGLSNAMDENSKALKDSVYKTCRELHGNLKQQEALLGPLVAAAAEIYRVDLKEQQTVQNIAWLIRTGCSVWPDAYASAIAAKAVRTLGDNPKPVSTKLFPNAEITLTDCGQYDQESPAEQKEVTDVITGYFARDLKVTFPSYWDEGYVRSSVHNACQISPGTYVYEIIGQLLRTLGSIK